LNSTHSIHPGLTVRFRGVRGSIPSPGMETARYGGNTSCVELRCDGHLLILDAGSGIRSLGNDLLRENEGQSIRADLLISHTHWDHIQGLPFFAPAYSGRNRLRILQTKGLTTRLEVALQNQMQPLHFPVGVDMMHGLSGIEEMGDKPLAVGPYSIRATALNHPGGCAGFRIETEHGSVAYLPDHEPFCSATLGREPLDHEKAKTCELVNFLRGVDLLILDTQYTETEYANHIGWGHGCLPDSLALALEAEVGQLAFFHHDPLHHDDQIDRMVSAAREIADSQFKVGGATEMQAIVLQSRLPSLVSGAPGF
jgi:phosphoribosyl 1,2-cyclic phosphodiesterase